MDKLTKYLEDPRRLWKLQLAVAGVTAAWLLAVNAWEASRDSRTAPPPAPVTAYTVEALPAPDVPLPLLPVAAQGMPDGMPATRADEPDGGDAAVAPSEAPPEEETPTEPVYYDIPLSRALQDYIRALCGEYAVPMALVLAIVEVESDFREDCVSSTQDYGLMQVNRCNFESCRAKFGDVDLLDPYDNLRCGVWLFSEEYRAEDGDPVRALMRYNCGPTGARRRWAQGINGTAYTRRVMAAFEKWEEAGR